MIRELYYDFKKETEFKFKWSNIQYNWYIPICFFIYWFFSVNFCKKGIVSLIISVVLSVILMFGYPSFYHKAYNVNFKIKIFSFLSAIGAVTGLCKLPFEKLNVPESILLNKIHNIFYFVDFDIMVLILKIAVIIMGLFLLFGIYIYFALFLDSFYKFMKKQFQFLFSINSKEKYLYLFLFFSQVSMIIFVYLNTTVFYGMPKGDIIYGLDSRKYFIKSAYLNLSYNLKEPIYAVFVAPFISIMEIFHMIFPNYIVAILFQTIHILFLSFSIIVLIKLINIKNKYIKYISILFFYSCFSQILFTISTEKYIFVLFYLVIFIYTRSVKNYNYECFFDRYMSIGATGTLITSCFLVPFFSINNMKNNFKKWFKEMLNFGITIITLIFLFGKADIILFLNDFFSSEARFVGSENSIIQNVFHYIHFVKMSIFYPNSHAIYSSEAMEAIKFAESYKVWWLEPINSISIVGLLLISTAFIGYLLNRKKYIVRISIIWMIFSFLVIGLAGWGTALNETAIYLLYFSWAIVLLVISLVDKLHELVSNLYIRLLIKSIYTMFVAIVIVENVEGMIKLLKFAFLTYPTL